MQLVIDKLTNQKLNHQINKSPNQKINKSNMTQEITYSQAQQKLEEIVAQMENNEIDLETLSVKLIEAKELVKLCENKLRNIEETIK